MRRLEDEATKPEDTEENTTHKETGLNDLAASAEEAEETAGNRATTESGEEYTDDESYVPQDNRDIEDGYEAETIIESRRSPGFNPPSDAEMSNIDDQSNYEVESIHGHRGSKVSGDPHTFPLQAP
jgi:hypothetical protein